MTICGGQKCGSSFGCVNAPRWRPTPIPHKHVNGRGRYMAAVCYTCYRPARTGYVRQSIALILALGAPLCVYRWWPCALRRRPYTVVHPLAVAAAAVAAAPLPTLSRVADPLHLSSQELHHQVITSTSSCVPSMVLLASHPRCIHRPRSLPKPLPACHRASSRHGLLGKKSRD